MTHSNELLSTSACDSTTDFTLSCGFVTVAEATVCNLEAQGWIYNAQARLLLIIDMPVGFALQRLESGSTLEQQKVVVVTWNPCPEYWEDLWDYDPTVLVADDALTINEAMRLTRRNTIGRFTPDAPLRLTACERKVLRLMARGYVNQDIATMLEIQHQSVRNTVTAIYQKLHLRDRSDVLTYYWGIWRWCNRGADEAPGL